MTDLIARYGRKFALACVAMALGFTVTVVGLVIIVAVPSAGVYVSEIVGQFALVLSVSIGAFSGSSAVVEWKHGGLPRSTTTVAREETITTVGTPQPHRRSSGTVMDPPETVRPGGE